MLLFFLKKQRCSQCYTNAVIHESLIRFFLSNFSSMNFSHLDDLHTNYFIFIFTLYCTHKKLREKAAKRNLLLPTVILNTCNVSMGENIFHVQDQEWWQISQLNVTAWKENVGKIKDATMDSSFCRDDNRKGISKTQWKIIIWATNH